MPKLRFLLCLLMCILPMAASAHMMGADSSNQTGFGMMQTIEERSMNATVHEEMEDLMEKMMEGTMTPAEQDRLVELMNQYPAGYSTMLDRMTGVGYAEGYCGMMNGGFWQGMPYYGMMGGIMLVAMGLGGLFLLVWLIVGILAIIWLLGLVSKR